MINAINVSFGYSHKLKTLYKQGKFPTLVKGIYGDVLTKDTVSLEHIKPHSQGGRTSIENLALASAKMNQKRGNQPLKDFINKEALNEYCEVFKKIKVGNFDGAKYIDKLMKVINEELQK